MGLWLRQHRTSSHYGSIVGSTMKGHYPAMGHFNNERIKEIPSQYGSSVDTFPLSVNYIFDNEIPSQNGSIFAYAVNGYYPLMILLSL